MWVIFPCIKLKPRLEMTLHAESVISYKTRLDPCLINSALCKSDKSSDV